VTGFLAALAFLTRLPVPGASTRLEPAVIWLPVVGVVLGGILALADLGMRASPLGSLVESVILVVLLLLLTGALHADGLMDTCDAAFVVASPERRLEIMRDPRTGTFGVVGVLCVVLLKVVSIETLPASVRAGSLILAPTLGRWSIVLLATVFPYGRPSGLGAPLKAAATPRALLLASLAPVLACVLLGPLGGALGVLAAGMALLLGRWMMSLLPGLTGDSYGASCEVVETVVWLAAAPLAHALA
jgi:adenosylcobinamide-GDP ribazoletransferase